MSYKVAVASSDGKVVNQHFGRATQFLIFDIEDGYYRLNELRKTSPFCKDNEHNDDLLNKAVELVSDCKAVLVSQVGPGAASILTEHGVRPIILPEFIDDALKKIMTTC